MQRIAALIVNEGNWLPFSMLVALISIAVMFYGRRQAELSTRVRMIVAMNLFFGITIAVMAIGHLMAIFVKHAAGTLRAGLPLLIAIGIALSIPAWGLVLHSAKVFFEARERMRGTIVYNGWLLITLVALGISNLPLAAPALFNIAYSLHSRRSVGWAILSVAVVFQVGLFVGGLMFLASGQSFEQFMGINPK